MTLFLFAVVFVATVTWGIAAGLVVAGVLLVLEHLVREDAGRGGPAP